MQVKIEYTDSTTEISSTVTYAEWQKMFKTKEHRGREVRAITLESETPKEGDRIEFG